MKLIPFATTRQIGRTILIIKKNSPHLFFAGGMLGSITSTVLACRATLQLPDAMDDIKGNLKAVRERKDNPMVGLAGREYTERDYIHDMTFVYGQSFKRLVKLYGPSVILGVASTGALTGSHIQLTRRNSELTVTVAALSKAYNDFRERVREQVGEEEELKLHRAIVDQKVDVDGKKETVPVVVDGLTLSPYARVFDSTSPNWQKDAELNRVFLMHHQEWANHRLNARGHVFLNEVYDDLGLERTPAGAVTGWILNGETSDNHISFGLHEAWNGKFMAGMERSAFLDFNVDGVVYDKI